MNDKLLDQFCQYFGLRTWEKNLLAAHFTGRTCRLSSKSVQSTQENVLRGVQSMTVLTDGLDT